MIDVTPKSLAGLMGGFNVKQWFKLPMGLRQRWWRETDYGKNPPSDELKAAIKEVLIA
jgi:hypothetical protein